MDAPALPPVIAGRSALPAFLAVEAWARERAATAREEAEKQLADGQAKAAAVKSDGERSLREAVLEGEREALRDVESQARDRISEARRALEAWIQASEEASESAVAVRWFRLIEDTVWFTDWLTTMRFDAWEPQGNVPGRVAVDASALPSRV